MKSKDRLTDSIVDSVIREKSPGKVEVEDIGLADEIIATPELADNTNGNLLKRIERNKHWRFFMIISLFFMMLVLVVGYAIYFINDVILYESEFFINEQGSFNPRKSLDSEYGLYLFNTSDIWANSGIQVNKKDKIKISISGGFNSSIKGVIDGAKDNLKINHSWLYSDSIYNNKTKRFKTICDINQMDYCLSKGESNNRTLRKEKYDFGTILYTIQPESNNISNYPLTVDNKDLKKWIPKNKFIRAKNSGYLYFAVNDLIFQTFPIDDKNNHNTYYDKKNEQYGKDTDTYHDWKGLLDRLKKGHEDDIHERKQIDKDPLFHYKDNLGQLLVAVEIQHHKPLYWLNPINYFRALVNRVNWLDEFTKKYKIAIISPLILLLGTMLCFLWFFIVNVFIICFWAVIFLAVITIIFYAISWLFKFIDSLLPSQTKKQCT